jgi:hypothetical protein
LHTDEHSHLSDSSQVSLLHPGAFNLFEEYYSNDGATRLRACKLAAGRIKLAVAQTSDAAFPPLR